MAILQMIVYILIVVVLVLIALDSQAVAWILGETGIELPWMS